MATELGNAYVQIVPSAQGIKGKITEELSGEATSAGQSAGNSIASAIKGAIVAAGIGAVLKSALTEGAALEQSLGGIETLYGDAADTMKEYASEAFKTAGLSANDYMQTATSFAAGLVSSLGGDTAAAAEVANQAIIDMSDNANKMGTSMESIQNAYQGFAKQNYTMLDNLKLGYGGTKTEMERLLADAQKISGVEYNIDNLSDVYSAIHVVQEELGITGTTATEAAETLSGSFASMQAAAKNVLGQLVLGEDVTPALEELISTASTFLMNNLFPAIGNVISNLPSVIGMVLTEVLPNILEQGATMIEGIADGMDGNIDELIAGAIRVITQLISTLAENAPKILAAGGKILAAIVRGIIEAIPDLIKALPEVITSFLTFFDEAGDSIVQVGTDIIGGIVEGIKGAAGKVWDALKGVVGDAIQKAKEFLGIASPSKLFRDDFGKMIDAGFAEGIAQNAGMVESAISDLNAATVNSMNAAISGASMAGATLSTQAAQSSSASSGDVISAILTAASTIVGAIDSKDMGSIKIGDREIYRAAQRGGSLVGSSFV